MHGPIVNMCLLWLMSELAENMADEIMSAILPEDDHDEIPTGFSVVGHIGKK